MEVVYNLFRSTGGSGLSLKVQTSRENAVVPSLVPVYPGADLQERETWDLLGIRFEGHPDLRRVLMWEGFNGHPLRKDWQEAYFEEEGKPFKSRWPEGNVYRIEDKLPYANNVAYPDGFDPNTWEPENDSALYESLKRNTFLQNMPFTDRLDYLSSMSNNFGYALAVEKLMGVKPPERAEYLRVIMAELTRISNHIFAIGMFLNDLGAYFTPALYAIQERELILDVFEAVSGSRMMCNYFRFGGVARDLPDGMQEQIRKLVYDRLPRRIGDGAQRHRHHQAFGDVLDRNRRG